MGRLTTHILDTANGQPAAGVAVRLFALEPERELVTSAQTNQDGRTDAPLLDSSARHCNEYEIEFDVGEYFAGTGAQQSNPAFLGTVVIRFAMNPDEDYHVPLLASPWSYSTYRGS
jgi:5-hydroxyisourate hydrolase